MTPARGRPRLGRPAGTADAGHTATARSRLALPAFTDRASKSIRRHLAHHGARIAALSGNFLIEGLTGPWSTANWGGPAAGESA